MEELVYVFVIGCILILAISYMLKSIREISLILLDRSIRLVRLSKLRNNFLFLKNTYSDISMVSSNRMDCVHKAISCQAWAESISDMIKYTAR